MKLTELIIARTLCTSYFMPSYLSGWLCPNFYKKDLANGVLGSYSDTSYGHEISEMHTIHVHVASTAIVERIERALGKK